MCQVLFTISFNPDKISMRKVLFYPPFTDEETKVQRG